MTVGSCGASSSSGRCCVPATRPARRIGYLKRLDRHAIMPRSWQPKPAAPVQMEIDLSRTTQPALPLAGDALEDPEVCPACVLDSQMAARLPAATVKEHRRRLTVPGRGKR